ncbi:hypothetical protein THAOC_16631 [Thalassiosira oceanica]|uniref:Uncharacterized protein n=1 Tax=Thalassiosira oceanica TaxID=159749 RepID=K0SX20_THAOC|nr:hypothetical protein THAOC_16631 [Thalassiosira oceanica]|eukprot:EJK62747.1 hypothetical protein THAOC_16631 [Thalassiosira oceanica]
MTLMTLPARPTPVQSNPPTVSGVKTSPDTSLCTMRLAAPVLTAEQRENKEVAVLPHTCHHPGTTSETAPYFSLSLVQWPADLCLIEHRQRDSTIADALDAPMHHETLRRRPSRRPTCTLQEISPPPAAPTRQHHRSGAADTTA